MNNIENIKTLLSKINSIYAKVKQVDEEKRKRGEYFNVFNILGLWSEEVRLHSSFLAELLNPNGNHGMGDAFLGQFLQLVIEERSNYIQSNKVSPEIVERYIGPNTEDEGGRLDIIIEAVGMLESIPLWIVTLLGSLLITVLSFIMILTVYGRMFKLYMYTAIAPIPISTFAGEPSQSVGKNFIKSYAGVCLEGAIIALACIIFSVYAASPPAVGDTSLSAVTIVWNYVGELVFNLLVLVGAVEASDRIVKEMMGL